MCTGVQKSDAIPPSVFVKYLGEWPKIRFVNEKSKEMDFWSSVTVARRSSVWESTSMTDNSRVQRSNSYAILGRRSDNVQLGNEKSKMQEHR